MPFIIVFVGDEGFSRHLFVDTHKFLARGGAECSRRGESHPSALSCADFLLKASLFRCHRFESLIPANRKNQKNNHPLVDDYFSGFILLGMRDSNPRNDGIKTRCLTAWLIPNVSLKVKSYKVCRVKT
jgi:hypothetical protein